MNGISQLIVFIFGVLYSTADIEFQTLHKRMTDDEFHMFFDSHNRDLVPDYEIISFPQPTHRYYNLTVFGKPVTLNLQKNKRLLTPDFKAVVRDENGESEIAAPIEYCHYLHSDAKSVAALSFCHENVVNGIIIVHNEVLEIQPLTPRLHEIVGNNADDFPHLIKRVPAVPTLWNDEKILPTSVYNETNSDQNVTIGFERPIRSNKRPTVEVALFFDEAAYKMFSSYMKHDDVQLRNMLLAYMNGVQALYHHPSIGQLMDITLVKLEIFKSQPADLPHYGGQRENLLDSFCEYNAKHNPPGDDTPQHWDMGLYVSALDFYAIENGRQNGGTMGLAAVGGVCMDKYACVIAELGTTNMFGKPYPSAGFTSVYILAHEIGHNLGMHHDGSSNNCPNEGFIMSPSRGTNGETLWSTCSADVMQKLSSKKCLEDVGSTMPAERNHNKMHDHPGQLWGAKRQCEVLLRDKDAELQNPDKTEDICQNLQCRTPHRSGFYYAGPALEGTACAKGKWCAGGECVVMKKQPSEKVVKGGWSKWQTEHCSSGCIQKSRGYQVKHRECNNPVPVNTEEGCEGASFDVALCKDDKICKKSKRKLVTDFAKKKCAEFSKTLSALDPNSSGLQAPHEEGRLWVACAIFCRRKDNGQYYTPRLDLNDLGVDPYFPDGTWCHSDGKHTYYCQNHHCLPENFRHGKSLFRIKTEDLALPQNAHPHSLQLPEILLKYLSLDSEGKPLLNTLKPDDLTKTVSKDDSWSSKDYIELPQPM